MNLSRTVKFSLVFCVLLVVFFLVSPFIVGNLVKGQFSKVINNLNQAYAHKAVSYSVIKYDNGWFTSKATLAVNVKLEGNKTKTYSETVNIKHGPFILGLPKSTNFSSHFGLAYFSGKFHLEQMSNIKKQQKSNFYSIYPFNINYIGTMSYKLNTNLMVNFDRFKVKFKQFKQQLSTFNIPNQ